MGSYFNSETNINIKQQPNNAPDASRLYGEILHKAKEDATSLRVVSTHGMNLNAEISLFKDSLSFNDQVYLSFNFNGDVIKINFEIEERNYNLIHGTYEEYILEECINKISHEIANKLCEATIHKIISTKTKYL